MLAWLPFPVWPFNLLITHVLVMQLHLWISGSLHAYLGECMNFSAIKIFSPALEWEAASGLPPKKSIWCCSSLPPACLEADVRRATFLSPSLCFWLPLCLCVSTSVCLSVCLPVRLSVWSVQQTMLCWRHRGFPHFLWPFTKRMFTL